MLEAKGQSFEYEPAKRFREKTTSQEDDGTEDKMRDATRQEIQKGKWQTVGDSIGARDGMKEMLFFLVWARKKSCFMYLEEKYQNSFATQVILYN